MAPKPSGGNTLPFCGFFITLMMFRCAYKLFLNYLPPLSFCFFYSPSSLLSPASALLRLISALLRSTFIFSTPFHIPFSSSFFYLQVFIIITTSKAYPRLHTSGSDGCSKYLKSHSFLISDSTQV